MYNIIGCSNVSYGIKQFAADSVSDMEQLPECEMGSTCLIIETKELYIKDSQGEWILWT